MNYPFWLMISYIMLALSIMALGVSIWAVWYFRRGRNRVETETKSQPAQVIVNPKYRAYGHWWNNSFACLVNIGDTAIHSAYGSIEQGEVRCITDKGINIRTQCGDRFIKWYHVLRVEKVRYMQRDNL